MDQEQPKHPVNGLQVSMVKEGVDVVRSFVALPGPDFTKEAFMDVVKNVVAQIDLQV